MQWWSNHRPRVWDHTGQWQGETWREHHRKVWSVLSGRQERNSVGAQRPEQVILLGRASRRRTSVTQVLNEGLKLREVEKDIPGSTNTVGKGNAAQNNMVRSWVPTHLFWLRGRCFSGSGKHQVWKGRSRQGHSVWCAGQTSLYFVASVKHHVLSQQASSALCLYCLIRLEQVVFSWLL